ncbi:MAG: hypothetical protein H6581_21070 [Bacteroidia bacterium]|nr:hypothetical protein [Bacteroidia bacterium]
MAKSRAKLIPTSESWLAAIFFVMNLIKFLCHFLIIQPLRNRWNEIIAPWLSHFSLSIQKSRNIHDQIGHQITKILGHRMSGFAQG